MEKLIDCHCHLDLYPDPEAVACEAAARGVYVISVTTTPTAFEKTAKLAPAGSRIRTALGLHPEIAASRVHELALFEALLPATRYVGEVGLDGSAPHRGSLEAQAGILGDILVMCRRGGGRIISLHSRSARRSVLDLLSLEPGAGSPILHWFTGTSREIDRAAELRCWFSIGPGMAASRAGRKSIEAMPKDRVLPETDGPFGTAKGEVALPWDAMSVADVLSEIWRQPVEFARKTLADNFRRLVSSDIPAE